MGAALVLVGLLLGLSQQAAALTEGLVDYIDAVSPALAVLACTSPLMSQPAYADPC